MVGPSAQQDLFETAAARTLLGRLFIDSRLYTQSRDYRDLLDFVVRLRNFAPFNAMLLHVQKPGLMYAASEYDWRVRFGRTLKSGARPLLIMWQFGPVALVYDLIDTEGREFPADAGSFFPRAPIGQDQMAELERRIARRHIAQVAIDAGEAVAGSIRRLRAGDDDRIPGDYQLVVNRNQAIPVQFATLAHELGHLFLGHLGPDRALNIPEEDVEDPTQRDLEAASVAFIVCRRNGVASPTQAWLNDYVQGHETIERLDLYKVMRAAGAVETLLGLAAKTRFGPTGPRGP